MVHVVGFLAPVTTVGQNSRPRSSLCLFGRATGLPGGETIGSSAALRTRGPNASEAGTSLSSLAPDAIFVWRVGFRPDEASPDGRHQDVTGSRAPAGCGFTKSARHIIPTAVSASASPSNRLGPAPTSVAGRRGSAGEAASDLMMRRHGLSVALGTPVAPPHVRGAGRHLSSRNRRHDGGLRTPLLRSKGGGEGGFLVKSEKVSSLGERKGQGWGFNFFVGLGIRRPQQRLPVFPQRRVLKKGAPSLAGKLIRFHSHGPRNFRRRSWQPDLFPSGDG